MAELFEAWRPCKARPFFPLTGAAGAVTLGLWRMQDEAADDHDDEAVGLVCIVSTLESFWTVWTTQSHGPVAWLGFRLLLSTQYLLVTF